MRLRGHGAQTLVALAAQPTDLRRLRAGEEAEGRDRHPVDAHPAQLGERGSGSRRAVAVIAAEGMREADAAVAAGGEGVALRRLRWTRRLQRRGCGRRCSRLGMSHGLRQRAGRRSRARRTPLPRRANIPPSPRRRGSAAGRGPRGDRSRRQRPDAEELPQQHHLPDVVRVVVGDQQRLAQQVCPRQGTARRDRAQGRRSGPRTRRGRRGRQRRCGPTPPRRAAHRPPASSRPATPATRDRCAARTRGCPRSRGGGARAAARACAAARPRARRASPRALPRSPDRRWRAHARTRATRGAAGAARRRSC